MLLCSIAHSIICTRLFRGKMHSDWFNGIEVLKGRWQHGEKVGYCYPSGLEKTLCKWDVYVPLVTKGLCRCFEKYWVPRVSSVRNFMVHSVTSSVLSQRHFQYFSSTHPQSYPPSSSKIWNFRPTQRTMTIKLQFCKLLSLGFQFEHLKYNIS